MIHALMTGDMTGAAETLLAVSLLILLVLVLRRPAARIFGAGIAYVLWAIPVARLLLPPMQSPFSLLNLDGLMPARAAEPAAMMAAVPQPVLPALTDRTGDTVAAMNAQPATLTIVPDTAVWTDDLLAIGLMAALSAWAAGAVFMIGRSVHAHWRFMQTVEREAMPVSARTEDLALRLAAETGLRRPPRLVASLISRGPFVTGLVRPTIVVPAWFEEDYTRIEARDALAHELMHVRRGDLWALQVSELFVAALWFNPLAYIARNAFRTDQESACDADVLSRCQTSPHAYGSTLVKAARLHLPEPGLAAASLPLTHALKERLTRMSYPAPSARRRMIGFGTAVLFGVSTLAITASVASAGEPGGDDVHEFRFESDSLLISDGDSDRQIVLLGDPMAKVMPVEPHPPELNELEAKIQAESAELSRLFAVDSALGMVDDPDFQEISRISVELALLGAELGAEGASESLKMDFSGMSEDEIEKWSEAFEARMEAKAAVLEARAAEMEARMEKHGAQIEARFEADSRFNAETERKAAIIEKRIERHSDEIERIMEERFGADFEARVEAQAEVIEFLVDSCEDADLKTGETRIIERADADGEIVRLVCVEGDRDRLKAAETLAAVDSFPGITPAEKAAFKAAAAGQKRKHVMVFRSDSSEPTEAPEPAEAPEPPEPPAAPEAPLKGE